MNEKANSLNNRDIPFHLADAIKTVAEFLKSAGVDNPRLDARLIVSHAAEIQPEDYLLRPKLELDASTRDRAAGLMMRRMLCEPMSHILGEREFWSLMFEVTSETLTPRPDTECLVESVLETFRGQHQQNSISILDVGTGTGCILLALLSELPDAKGVGVDINPLALDVARRNAIRHEMESRSDFLVSNYFDSVEGIFDLIVSNPPYIKTSDIAGLEVEVAQYEPLIALDGGQEGLSGYREIAREAPAFLKPGGKLAVEVGFDQSSDVAFLFRQSGFSSVEIYQDLSQRDRVVMAIYS